MDIDTLCESTKLRLIANALGLQQCTKTAACVIPITGTQDVIAIGPRGWIAKNVPGVEAMVGAPVLADLTRYSGKDISQTYVLEQEGEFFAAEDVERLFARLAATTQASTAQAERMDLLMAALNCGHSIDDEHIVLHRDRRKDGNATKQLGDRLSAAVATSSTDAQAAAKKEQIIAIANASGIDTDDEGDIFGSTNGAIFKFVESLGVQAAAEVRDAALDEAITECDLVLLGVDTPEESVGALRCRDSIRALRSAGDTGEQADGGAA